MKAKRGRAVRYILIRFYDQIIHDRETMPIEEVCKKWGLSKKAVSQIGKGKTNINNEPMTNEERERWLKKINERN